MSKFPYRASDDKAVENAQQVLKARYYQTVRSYATDILKEAQDAGYEDIEEARGFIDEKVHETADGSAEVIYTHRAINTLYQSDNWTEIDEVGLEGSASELSSLVTVAAYYALRADILEQVEADADEYLFDPEDEEED